MRRGDRYKDGKLRRNGKVVKEERVYWATKK